MPLYNPTAGTTTANTFTKPQTYTTTETASASARPVQSSMNFLAEPSSAPGITADYHGIDLVTRSDSANFNSNCSIYPLESNAQLDVGAGGADRLVAVYGFANNLSSGTVATDMTSYQAWQRNLGAGTVALIRGIRLRTPDNSGGGTVTAVKGIHIEDQTGVATAANTYAIYSAGGQSFFAGKVGVGNASVPSANVHIQPTADGDIGMLIQAKSATQSGNLVRVSDNNNSVVFFQVGPAGLTSVRSATSGTQLTVQGPASNAALQVLDGTSSVNLGTDATGTNIKTGASGTTFRFIQGSTARFTINGSSNLLFNSANKPTLPADATDLATAIALANALKSALVLYTLAA